MTQKRLSHFVPPVKRHPSLQDASVVRKLMDAHAELRMQQAVNATAQRFGISEEEVLAALRGDNFFVKLR